MIPPILISGCRRSGTTLLRTLLHGHPAFHVHPDEPQFIHEWVNRHGDQPPNLEQAIEFVVTHRLCPRNVTKNKLVAYFMQNPPLSWREFVHGYLQVWAEDQIDKKRIVLKDPRWLFELDLVDHLFPKATFIHIVRDPRANVSSQKSRWHNTSTYSCALLWQTAVSIGHQLSIKRPDSCITLHYESLVLEPEKTLKKLCTELGVDYLSNMLNFELKTLSFAPEEKPKKVTFNDFRPERLEQWKERLSNLDVALIEQLCHPQMTLFNYRLTNPIVAKWQKYVAIATQKGQHHLIENGRKIRNLLR